MLKVLYESLVDPDERHDLGEYYTPDWLAGRVVAEAVDAPLTQRVLDPACGSGTFLFHALRRLIAAGPRGGMAGRRIVEACADRCAAWTCIPSRYPRPGHLAAGHGRAIADRPPRLTVPVFLGDAMQWNLRRFVDRTDVLVDVPARPPLRIPLGFAERPGAIRAWRWTNSTAGLADDADTGGRWPGAPPDRGRQRRGRGRVGGDLRPAAGAISRRPQRHLDLRVPQPARPVWLSRAEQRADVLVGNPPWIVYRHLSAGDEGPAARGACSSYELWVGGSLATQQDMCALFWARGAERYLKHGGASPSCCPMRC